MDPQVLKDAKNGDKTAFGRIIEDTYKDAYLFALSITGSTHDARDVCQEAFIKAYRNICRLNDDMKFKSWLMKIVLNTSRDFFRASKAKTFEPEDCSSVFAEERIAERNDLFKAISVLKREYRQVLILRYINDMKIEDMAKILGIPGNTVKSRIRYALERARTVLEGK